MHFETTHLECREITLDDIVQYGVLSNYLGKPCIFENGRPTLIQSSISQGEEMIEEIERQRYYNHFKYKLDFLYAPDEDQNENYTESDYVNVSLH